MSDIEYLTAPQPDAANPNGRARTLKLTGVLVAALVVAVGIALAARGPDSKDDAHQVREVDQTLRQALVAGDAVAADRILAPDFELVDPSGDKESRDQYLGSVSSGHLTFQRFEPVSRVRVRVSGDVAVVSYESRLAVSAGAVHLEHRAWHTHVYERSHGRWQQVWAQTTAVGGFPPPGN